MYNVHVEYPFFHMPFYYIVHVHVYLYSNTIPEVETLFLEIACDVQKLLALGGLEEMEKLDNEEELAMEVEGM